MDTKLNQAIAAIKAGDKKSGGEILAELVQSEPGNEQAWYWLSVCVKTIEQKKYCLKRVLENNPSNLQARQTLAKLEQPVKTTSLFQRLISSKIIALAGLGVLFLSVIVVILIVTFNSPRLSASEASAAPISEALPVTAPPVPAGQNAPEKVVTPTRVPKYTQIPEFSVVNPIGNAEYNLPPAPRGFTWKVIPSLLMDTLVPDGWFFIQSQDDDADLFFVTKENLAANGKFSTGMSVKIFHNIENVDQAAQDIIFDLTNQATTVQVIDSFQLNSKTNTITMYSALFAEEFSDKDSGDPDYQKKRVCDAIADTFRNKLYIIEFESPQESWDTDWKEQGGPVTLSVINLLFAGR